METKMKIIEITEQVKKMVGIGHSYNMNCLTISMILKNKDLIMKREVCYTDDVSNSIEEMWKRNGWRNLSE